MEKLHAFMEKHLTWKNVIIFLISILFISFLVFLFDKDPGGKTGWQIIEELPIMFTLLVIASGVGAYFGVRFLLRQYRKDGNMDMGGIHYGFLILALVVGLFFLKGCDAKADSSVPRNPIDTVHRQAAQDMIDSKK